MRRGSNTLVAKSLVSATADQEYKERSKEARRLLMQIDQSLRKHERQQMTNRESFSYPGDVGHVIDLLNGVLDFIGR